MKLATTEKLKIFFALLEKYPEHERARRQAEHFFGSQPEKLKKHMKSINDSERSAYELIKRFADEVGWEIPEYSEPMITARSCENNTEKIIQIVSVSQTDEDIKNVLENEGDEGKLAQTLFTSETDEELKREFEGETDEEVKNWLKTTNFGRKD